MLRQVWAGKEGHSRRAEPFTYGLWCYLQVDGVRVKLNYNTSSSCWTIWGYIVKKKKHSAFIWIWYQSIKNSTTLKVGKFLGISQGLTTYLVSPAILQISVPPCPSDPMTKFHIELSSHILSCWNLNAGMRFLRDGSKMNEAASGLDPFSSPILVRSCENLWSETMSAFSKVWWAGSFFATKETFLIPRSMEKVLISQSCPTLWGPMDYRSPGSSVHGILQARILECVSTTVPRRSSWPRDRTWVSHIAGRFFTVWTTKEALNGTFVECLPCVSN